MVVSEQEPLTIEEQDAVLQDIALVLAHNLPSGWQECLVVHSAVGAHAETTVRIERLNGPPADVEGPQALDELFARLRAGMYRPGLGAWFSISYRLTHPVDYQVEYESTARPDWSTPPPPDAYADELRRFPRDPAHTPDWLRSSPEDTTHNTADDQADADVPGFQMARVFDSLGPGETPRVDRPPVPDDEIEAVADYLTKAPMVLAARSLDNDLLDPARPEKVPLTYLTDGTWIWPGGVGYYLRTHRVPPEPELVGHIRRQGYQPPEVDDYTRDVAVATIMGQPPPPRPSPPAPAVPEPAPPQPLAPESPASEMVMPEPVASEMVMPEPVASEIVMPEIVTPEIVMPEPIASEPVPEAAPDASVPHEPPEPPEPPEPIEPARQRAADQEPAPPEEATPADVAGVQAAAERDGPVLDRLRDRLTEVGAAPESYCIEAVVDGAWCLVREGGGWAVFRATGGDRTDHVGFAAADQAAAYLLGSLLMAADGPRPPVSSLATSDTGPDAAPEPGRPATAPAAPARKYDGPIEPLPGEPPFTLFRNLREFELAAGTEIDRVGDPAGNLTYAAGTRYSQRSLPAEWADRPYHVYRLGRPVRVLIGTAIPWFDQPGGGTGYFLPVSVAELIADGVLMEVDAESVPK